MKNIYKYFKEYIYIYEQTINAMINEEYMYNNEIRQVILLEEKQCMW